MTKCDNCGTESDGKFCPECGHKMQFTRMSMKAIFYDKIHDITHWENTVLYTLRHLLFSPGTTVKNYVTGVKRNIVKPIKYFLSVTAVHVIVFHWLNKRFFDFQHRGEAANEIKEAALTQNILDTYLNYFDFFLPVFFSLFFFLLYRKKTGVNYAESFAVSFYWIGTTMIVNVMSMLLSLIDMRLWYTGLVVNIIYLVLASVRFSESGKFSDYMRGISFVALSYISFLFAAFGVILFYINFIK